MTGIWKIIITILLLSIIVTDANRARRRRRQTVLNAAQPSNQNTQVEARQQPLPLGAQGSPQQLSQSGIGLPKDMNMGQAQGQSGRQYYPYQNQYQMGSQGYNYYPYSGGGSQYGQYGQYGQGMGSYGSYYNQNPNSYYGGYNSGYNRPGYSNNYPSGSNYNYGSGYFWNAGQKQNVNTFIVFLSSFLALVICLITV